MTPRSAIPPAAPPAASRRDPRTVVVKFKDLSGLTHAVHYVDDFQDVLLSLGGKHEAFWHAISGHHPGLRLMRRFRRVDPAVLQARVQAGLDPDLDPPPVDMRWYFSLDVPAASSPWTLAQEFLSHQDVVENAYVAGRCSGPGTSLPSDDRAHDQHYLDAARAGIGRFPIWGVTGSDGGPNPGDVQVVDVEEGWHLDHPDLPATIENVAGGYNCPSGQSHGTAVLGILFAKEDGQGCVGIVPSARAITSSTWPADCGDPTNQPKPEEAILLAIPLVKPGDVMLLEIQSIIEYPGHVSAVPGEILDPYRRPAEAEFGVRQAIQLAVQAGIVVVEATGDGSELLAVAGSIDLDQLQDEGGRFILNPSSPDFLESGAILVGAGDSSDSHVRIAHTNFGHRVDCYAWGEKVLAPSWSPVDPAGYHNFGLTSSASAIIAGAAASIQGMLKARGRAVFSPDRMRRILSDPNYGTPCRGFDTGTADDDQIGVMPNLAAIEPDLTRLVPDIFIRAYPGDDGVRPPAHVGESPDIVVLPAQVSPERAFADDSLGGRPMPVIGTARYAYVRAHNRSLLEDGPVVFRLFPIAASTVPVPLGGIGPIKPLPSAHWKIPSVAGGCDVFAGPFVLPDDLLASGEPFGLLALVSSPDDRAPRLPSDGGKQGVLELARSNNVAWRTVFPAPMSRAGGFLLAGREEMRLPFDLHEALRGMVSTLAVDAVLPDGAQLQLEAPSDLLAAMSPGLTGLSVEPGAEAFRLAVDLERGSFLTLDPALHPWSRMACALLVSGLDGSGAPPAGTSPRITLRHLLRPSGIGRPIEVARLTWRPGGRAA